ncbi:hypothetical protein ALC62_12929 [Cyphomyrmex costatus]|uniref:Uncharacterized protein n=1 Tax=Cyphomyrmex costatus TaxID=456900 RepID=A0A195C8H3_9HYME|nr:hypothetical protein ALC62_12929 [Cyphomyrmex costatus]
MDAEGEGKGEERGPMYLPSCPADSERWSASQPSQPAVLAIALMRFTERRKDAVYLSPSFTAFAVTVPCSSRPTIRRVRRQGRGKTAPRNLSIFVSKWRHSRAVGDDNNIGHHTRIVFPLITPIQPYRRRTNDDDLCKLQPVLNTLRSPTLADSSKTFRNNSAPRARSCVPRPGSFLPFLR